MISNRKFIVEMDGVAVYSTKNYECARRVAWRLIRLNKWKEIIVQIGGLIVGI